MENMQNTMDMDDMGSVMPASISMHHGGGLIYDEEASVSQPSSHADWTPHHVMTEWENSAGVRCISMIVNLSSGSAFESSENTHICLIENGNTVSLEEVWSDMTQDMDVFYSEFKKEEDEDEDDFAERRFAMRRTLRKLMFKHANGENRMVSVFNKQLPFKVEASEMRIKFIGDKVGGRCCHIDLVEQKLQEAKKVLMMDDVTDSMVPESSRKRKFKITKVSRQGSTAAVSCMCRW